MTDAAFDSVKSLYSNDMFEKWGNQPHELRDYERQLIENHCPDRALRFLNVGCGGGRESFSLFDLGYHQVTGLDCTPALVEVAQRKALARGLPLKFHLGSASELPFPDDSFDVITIFENVYGHITPRANRLATLGEARRCLRTGGLVIIVATSLENVLRYGLAIRLMELSRWFHNPHRLEKGDKVMANAHTVAGAQCLARSHWFRAMEIDEEAEASGLKVHLASTVAEVLRDPLHSCRRLRGKGRLVYLLKK